MTTNTNTTAFEAQIARFNALIDEARAIVQELETVSPALPELETALEDAISGIDLKPTPRGVAFDPRRHDVGGALLLAPMLAQSIVEKEQHSIVSSELYTIRRKLEILSNAIVPVTVRHDAAATRAGAQNRAVVKAMRDCEIDDDELHQIMNPISAAAARRRAGQGR